MKPESCAASWLQFFLTAGIDTEFAEHYAVTFSKNQIQLDMLPEINKDYLNDMGISLLGHVIAILRHAKLVYADEIKKLELSSMKRNPLPPAKKPEPQPMKKSDAKLTKGIKDSKPPPPPLKTSKAPPPKPSEEYEKPTSSVVKRKSTVVQLPASESSEPKMKVRKTLCDSSDDITIPKGKVATDSVVISKPKPTATSTAFLPKGKPATSSTVVVSKGKTIVNHRLNHELPNYDETRKGVFKRLGVEVSQSTEIESSQSNNSNVNGVFSRLGGKLESPQVIKLPASKQVVSSSKEITRLPSATKSIIRTRLNKIAERHIKPKRTLPLTYMDMELEKTERRQASQLASSKHSTIFNNRNIKSRLGFTSSKEVSEGPSSLKKVSFGTVTQKLIPKVKQFPTLGRQKYSSQSISSKFSLGGHPSGVFSRLGTVPQ